METFTARLITREMADKGYNNEGRGELIGYVAIPAQHEKTCRYRISTGGNPDKTPHESCSCRIGLWQENKAARRVVNEKRKTSKRAKGATKKPIEKQKGRKRH